MMESYLWLPPGTRGIRMLVGSPPLADREQAMVVVVVVVMVSCEVVTTWVTVI
jgi:hypothetical protein